MSLTHLHRPNRLTDLLRAGKRPLAGVLTVVADPAFVEECGFAGLDFVALDLEHSTISDTAFEHAVRAGESAGMAVLARLSPADKHRIGRLLDVGGDGILAAHVTSAADVDELVRETHFPPAGRRGAGATRTNSAGSTNVPQWLSDENERVFLGVMIEDSTGVDGADKIAAHPEVDAILVGTRDLTVDLQIPGQFDHPRVTEAIGSIHDCCVRHGKPLATMVRDLAAPPSSWSPDLRFVPLGAILRPAVEAAHG